MTQAVTYRDTEGPLRSWLRTQSVLTDEVGASGIFFGIPKGRPLPLITMSKLDGATDLGEGPHEYVDITFAIWANSKAQAAEITAALKTLLRSTPAGTALTSLVMFDGAEILSDRWLPDTSTDADTARYILDVRFTVKGFL